MNIHIINRDKGEIMMECAKDTFFEVRYNTKLDRLVIKKERWISKLFRTIKRHKLITTVTMAFIVFSIVNIIMIYSFMRILQNL